MAKVPIERQLACARREVGKRKQVYPRRIEAGTMTAAFAADEIAAMEAIVETLDALAAKERLI